MIASAERAEALRALHRGPRLLVLPNAWDVASAVAFAEAGFSAIATTSGGVAGSLGHADGEKMPPDGMFAAVARIAGAVDIPVTADLEAGYGLSPAELAERVIATGAVGLNLEDTDHRGAALLVDADVQAERLSAVKQAGRAAGVDLVLNARVDVHVRQVGAPETRLDEALRRGRLYRDAGADCIYPIAVADEPTITAFVDGLGCPVNVLVRDGAPSTARLEELGVCRATFGSGLLRAALARAREVAEASRLA